MNQDFGICKLSVVPLRSEPSDRSEIVSQLLYGDHCQIIEKSEKWFRIKMAYDGYEGWMDPKQLDYLDEEQYEKLDPFKAVLGLQVYHTATSWISNESMNLLPGSSLPDYEDGRFGTKGREYVLDGAPVQPEPASFSSGVEAAAKFYLNSPYLWGGKTPFGIDCSGFTQVVFKQFGIRLQRDASQQALQGSLVAFLQEAVTGDLAFFDNEEGRITHVGIMLGNDNIIHASGKVRIDPIDDQGIFNKELNRYTHQLRVIKRYTF